MPSAEALAPRREVMLTLDGVHCANCVARVQQVLAGQVDACDVDLATRTAAIRFDPTRHPLQQWLRQLRQSGFEPRLLEADEADAADAHARRRSLARIGIAVIGAMQVMMLAWPSYFDGNPEPDIAQVLRWAQWVVSTPVVLWAGAPFLLGAARALRQRTLTMDVPVALSITLCYLASALRTLAGDGHLFFDTATMFVALLLLGRHFEGATRTRAGARLRQLAASAPATAQRLGKDGTDTVPIAELVAGDRVRVMPGEALPVDGDLECAAELDESLLTGESRPVLREAGATAMAGSLNLGQSPLVLRAVATGEHTRVAAILRLLQRAAARKPQVHHLADRVAGHFTLAVLLLAAAAGALAASQGTDQVLTVVIAVMVASCPCALSLAVPAVLAAATARLAANGVLVARADRLLRLADVDVVLVDKTGTLTESALSVEQVQALSGHDADAALRIAARLEQGLAHPIAQAFAVHGDGRGAESLRFEVGRGVAGEVDGAPYHLGPAAAEIGGARPGLTWVALSGAGGAIAHFGLAAAAREDAARVVRQLRAQHIDVALLTGDSLAAAQDVAQRVGIDDVQARLTPDDKLARLRKLQSRGRVVLCVGDGLNDAPFLAAADVSAAMPAGAAVTQARADILLVNEQLDGLLLARDLARQARLRVRQNLAWAAAYNASVLPLAFLGLLAPELAAAGMSLSSLLVVGNALRLRVPQPQPEPNRWKVSTC